MTLPNFLIIGAAKSGTTALYTYMKQHPEIFMSSPKELRFFNYTGSYPEDLDEIYIHRGVTTLKEYKSHFDFVKNEKAIGEVSPMYLYVPGTAERIKSIIPDVKLMAILRNPVDRAYSAYTHALRDWIEPTNSFVEALAKEKERIEAGWGMLWHYTNAGFYYKQLSRYYNVFEPDKIKVMLYDDLISSPDKLLMGIFDFLDVDSCFTPDTNARPNVSGFPKKPKLHYFLKRLFMDDNLIKRASRKLFQKAFRRKVMNKIVGANLEKRAMPQEIRSQLQELFRDDINNLEELIQRDLSHWLE